DCALLVIFPSSSFSSLLEFKTFQLISSPPQKKKKKSRDHMETVCLQLSRKQAVPIHVTVSLQSKAGNATLIMQTISQLIFFHCTSFQVPPPVGQPEEVAFVEIKVLGANSEFEKKQKVLIKHAEKKTLIQTDKPVYKPGQIGMVITPCVVRGRGSPQATNTG
uniref:Uncharacterized protein n=1 Tax=Anser brachyrhynchus TaxID=132585 RepID=A0A8B9I7X4_9AVES